MLLKVTFAHVYTNTSYQPTSERARRRLPTSEDILRLGNALYKPRDEQTEMLNIVFLEAVKFGQEFKNTQGLPKISPISPQDLPKIFPRSLQDLFKMSPRSPHTFVYMPTKLMAHLNPK